MLIAHVQILDAAMSVDQYSGMGTTIVVTLVSDGRLSVAHVGDSRLYLFGPRLRQLTRDDSWMASVLAADSRADRSFLEHHPIRNALTNVVGAGVRTDVHVIEEELRGDVRLVLTTDGVHGVLDEEQRREGCWGRAGFRPRPATWSRRHSPAAAATTARLWSLSTIRRRGPFVCRWTEACPGREPHAIFVRFC